MALYRIQLDQFHIDNTRSRHEDTDSVAFAVQVPPLPTSTQSLGVGDVNNGDHAVGLTSARLFVSATGRPAIFSFVIYNGDSSKLNIPLDDLVDNVVDTYLTQIEEGGPQNDPDAEVDIPDQESEEEGLNTGPDFADTSWLNILELAEIASFFSPDCDGIVVADGFARSKSSFDTALANVGSETYQVTRRYPGTDSPAGCGSNSDYTATWSVTRYRLQPPGPYSLREFLTDNGVDAHAGLRYLTGGPGFGIRDLIT